MTRHLHACYVHHDSPILRTANLGKALGRDHWAQLGGAAFSPRVLAHPIGNQRLEGVQPENYEDRSRPATAAKLRLRKGAKLRQIATRGVAIWARRGKG